MPVLVGLHVMTLGCDRSGFPKAVYGDMEYVFQQDKVWLFTWRSQDDAMAAIYIKLPSGRVVFLPEISEDVASELTGGDAGFTPIGHGSTKIYTDSGSTIVFRSGQLSTVKLNSDGKLARHRAPSNFTLSANKDGPFVEMPINKDDLVALLGKPEKWGWYNPPLSP